MSQYLSLERCIVSKSGSQLCFCNNPRHSHTRHHCRLLSHIWNHSGFPSTSHTVYLTNPQSHLKQRGPVSYYGIPTVGSHESASTKADSFGNKSDSYATTFKPPLHLSRNIRAS